MLIAICDDTKADAEKIRFSLMDITSDLEMVWFETGARLIDSIKKGKFIEKKIQKMANLHQKISSKNFNYKSKNPKLNLIY